MNNYVPAFLSAVSKMNYKTYITWNRADERDTADMTQEKAESSYTMLAKDNQEYRFNAGGQLVYRKEPNGSFVFLKYDEKTGRLISITTNQNLVTRFLYEDDAKMKTDELVENAITGKESESETGTVPKGQKDGVQRPSEKRKPRSIDMTAVAAAKVAKGAYKDSTVGETSMTTPFPRWMKKETRSLMNMQTRRMNT